MFPIINLVRAIPSFNFADLFINGSDGMYKITLLRQGDRGLDFVSEAVIERSGSLGNLSLSPGTYVIEITVANPNAPGGGNPIGMP